MMILSTHLDACFDKSHYLYLVFGDKLGESDQDACLQCHLAMVGLAIAISRLHPELRVE